MKKVFLVLMALFVTLAFADYTPFYTQDGVPTLDGAGKVVQTCNQADTATYLDTLQGSDFVKITGGQTVSGELTFGNTVTFDNGTAITNDTGDMSIGGSLTITGTCVGCGGGSLGDFIVDGSSLINEGAATLTILNNSNMQDVVISGVKNDVATPFMTFTHNLLGFGFSSIEIPATTNFMRFAGADDWSTALMYEGSGRFQIDMGNSGALDGYGINYAVYYNDSTGELMHIQGARESDEVKAFLNHSFNANTGVITSQPEAGDTWNIIADTFTGDGSGLIDVDAVTLDSLDSTDFVRSGQDIEMAGFSLLNANGTRTLFGSSNGKFKADGVNNNATGSVEFDTDTFVAKTLLHDVEQDLDTVYAYHLPKHYTGFDYSETSDPVITASVKVSDADNTLIEVVGVIDSEGALQSVSGVNSNSTSFETLNVPYSDVSGGTFTAGGKFFLVLKCTGNDTYSCSVDDEQSKAAIKVTGE